MRVLVINSGSSSIKYKLFEMPRETLLVKGTLEHIGEAGAKIKNHREGLQIILKKINDVWLIGHRVVHGAEEFKKPVLISDLVINKIKQCNILAPLHNPANLEGILACKAILPGVKQIAVFDTAFHQTLPEYAYIYGLPYVYYRKYGVRKYGFHGTSHEFVATESAKVLKKPFNKLKIITCHLGNGCSITAVNKAESVDTSMGFTPLEGLVMGTRCGDIDPALVTYIMRREKLNIAEIEAILNKTSGLKGISGISNDMRVLFSEAISGNKKAKLAIDIFVYRIRKYIGAYAAIMGGCDALVFTAGIGENQESVRKMVCDGLFSYFRKKPRVLVIPTDEELMIARKSFELVRRR